MVRIQCWAGICGVKSFYTPEGRETEALEHVVGDDGWSLVLEGVEPWIVLLHYCQTFHSSEKERKTNYKTFNL